MDARDIVQEDLETMILKILLLKPHEPDQSRGIQRWGC